MLTQTLPTDHSRELTNLLFNGVDVKYNIPYNLIRYNLKEISPNEYAGIVAKAQNEFLDML